VIKRVRDLFPFTVGGLILIGASLLATLYYGKHRLDHILLAVGVVGLSLSAISTLFVGIAALITWRAARKIKGGEPLLSECGHAQPTGFSLPSLWWLPFVDIRWTWLEPTAKVIARRKGRRVIEEIEPAERDNFPAIVRRIEIGEVFGVARIAFHIRQDRPGRFAPWIGGLEGMQVAHGLSGGDQMAHPEGSASGDYYDMRRYGAGDPIKFVLWKVFARTRDLLVRTPEYAIAPDQRTVAYLVAADGDEPAAGAARIAVDSGALGTKWVLGADGCPEPASNGDEAIEVLTRSARADENDSGSLAAFLTRVSKGPTTRAVVFVPARPGPWMDKVTAAAAGAPGQYPRVEFVVCTDGIGERVHRSRWSKAALVADDSGAPAPAVHEDLVAVVDALSQTGANVLIVDRPGGRLVNGRNLKGVRT
jgi:hypothetical protein